MRRWLERRLLPTGRCLRCERPWKVTGRYFGLGVDPHSTRFTVREDGTGRGMFPLCDGCWDALTPYERLTYYRQLWNQWLDILERDGLDEEADLVYDEWAKIRNAVLAGS